MQAAEQWIEVEPDSEEAMRTASILYLRTGNVRRAAGHLGDVGGTDAELIGPGPEAVGKRVVLGHIIPTHLWMK